MTVDIAAGPSDLVDDARRFFAVLKILLTV
jgi:hypothetical protein